MIVNLDKHSFLLFLSLFSRPSGERHRRSIFCQSMIDSQRTRAVLERLLTISEHLIDFGIIKRYVSHSCCCCCERGASHRRRQQCTTREWIAALSVWRRRAQVARVIVCSVRRAHREEQILFPARRVLSHRRAGRDRSLGKRLPAKVSCVRFPSSLFSLTAKTSSSIGTVNCDHR